MTRSTLYPVGLLSLLLFSCGKEVGRVRFAGEGAGEANMVLEAKAVSFWTDLEIAYEGDGTLTYSIELLQGGTSKATAVCNPLGPMSVKTGWLETNLGSSHKRRGNGKMSCEAKLDTGGPTTVRTKLAFARLPSSVQLTKADLVIKQ